MLVFSVISAILFSLVVCLRDVDRYPKYIIHANSFMSAAILLVLAAYIWLVRESLMKKLMVFFIVLFYAETEFLLVNLIHTCLYHGMPSTALYPYSTSFLLLYAVTTALFLPLMIAAVIRPVREYIQMIEPKDMKHEFLTATLSTVLYFALTIYSDTVFGKADIFNLYVRLNLPLLLFMMFNQVLIYWMIFKESVRREIDNERWRAMEIQQLQYEKIVSDMESTRRMRHDLHHHYNSLSDMLNRGQIDEVKDYLSKAVNTTVSRDNEIYCKNMTVNGLLQYYIGLARDENIKCEVQAECGEVSIEPSDLTVMFGNAMENAINACRKYPENRWINIKIGTIHNSLAIEISNSCKGVRLNRHFLTEDGFSPAEAFLSDRSDGGHGLRSIAHTAHKYGGSASFRYNADKEKFTSRIRLNTSMDI